MAKRRILVADDHAETRQLIATLLGSEFDVVATVADGRAAVEAAASLHPDLVVLDISMPVLNGLEAAAIISDSPDPPMIVFSTAYDDQEFVDAAAGLGASGFVLKRNMLELVSVIRRALSVHAVYFYEDAQSLSRTVASFIGAGLVANQPVVLIATPSHGRAILEQLIAMAFDPLKLIGQGELVTHDAHEVLSRFMGEEMPDARRFEDSIGPILDRAGSGERKVRAYGEMVDLLCQDAKGAAAVSLEILWNQLLARRHVSLLCSYRSDGFAKGAGFKKICDQHSHVVSADNPLPHG